MDCAIKGNKCCRGKVVGAKRKTWSHHEGETPWGSLWAWGAGLRVMLEAAARAHSAASSLRVSVPLTMALHASDHSSQPLCPPHKTLGSAMLLKPGQTQLSPVWSKSWPESSAWQACDLSRRPQYFTWLSAPFSELHLGLISSEMFPLIP